MTAKRLPKKQPKRDRLIVNTLLRKSLAECTLEECLRLNAFFDTVLKYLAASQRDPAANVARLSARKTRKPARRVWPGEDSQAA